MTDGQTAGLADSVIRAYKIEILQNRYFRTEGDENLCESDRDMMSISW